MPSTSTAGAGRVLLVEDNLGDVLLIQEAFLDVGSQCHVDVARDGATALAMLRREPPHTCAACHDLVLLDINLPKRNGHEVLAELKQDPALRRIPVVMLTSSPAERDKEQSYALNANAYLCKPSNLRQYADLVRAIEGLWVKFKKHD